MAVACVLVALFAGCGPATDPGPLASAAPEIDAQECAVCGMLVRDQPAPRARAIHRDGTEAWACSLGDLLVHLAAPSPHGRVTRVQVEVMQPGEDPALGDVHAHAWVAADTAWYVVGVERRGIMGPPVLAYAKREGAEAVARGHDGRRVLDFAALEAWWTDLQR